VLGAMGGIEHPGRQEMLFAGAQSAQDILVLVHPLVPQSGHALPVQRVPLVRDDNIRAKGGFIWIGCWRCWPPIRTG